MSKHIESITPKELERHFLERQRIFLAKLRAVWATFPEDLQPPEKITIVIGDGSRFAQRAKFKIHPEIKESHKQRVAPESEKKLKIKQRDEIAWGMPDKNLIELSPQVMFFPTDDQKRILAHEAAELLEDPPEIRTSEQYSPEEEEIINEYLQELFEPNVLQKLTIKNTRMVRHHFKWHLEVSRTYNANKFIPVVEFYPPLVAALIPSLQEIFPVLFEYITLALLKHPLTDAILSEVQLNFMIEEAKKAKDNQALIRVVAELLKHIEYATFLRLFRSGDVTETRKLAHDILLSLDENQVKFLSDLAYSTFSQLFPNKQIPKSIQKMAMVFDHSAKTFEDLLAPDMLVLMPWLLSYLDHEHIRMTNEQKLPLTDFTN